MLRRAIRPLLQRRLADNPAVALVGPRQSGKTTLARALRGIYYDLEQDADRLRLNLEWDDRMTGNRLVVLDEAQAWPEVFPRLRGAIDARRDRNGRFLLLGSVSPALMTQVSESLAGRLALMELTPFLSNELPTKAARSRHWFFGGFPQGGVLEPRRFPQWQRDYVSLLAQRDLPNWGLPAKPQVTLRLLRMLAALHGQMWNASQLGASMGLSYQTINSYADYLEGAYLIRRLAPYHANLKKRLVKSPKVYWRDTGLLHAMLNIEDADALLAHPSVGASWEGFIIEQILGVLAQVDRPFEAFWLRTSDQHELDLVLQFGRRVWAVEIKLTTSPGAPDMDRLNRAADMIDAERRILVSRTADVVESSGRVSCNLNWILGDLLNHPPHS